MSTTYIESPLSDDASHVHRALASLQEELEATDWYNQRADVAADPELKAILIHNRNEELEHASMLLEYLRRKMPDVDAVLKTYLFSDLPITEIEEAATGEGDSEGDAAAEVPPAAGGSLGIGRVKK